MNPLYSLETAGAEIGRLKAELERMRQRDERLTAQLKRNRQGLQNILEFRKLTADAWGTRDGYGGRYGALTREEIEESIAEIDAALSQADSGKAQR